MGGGLRVPIGNRIAHESAALTWRTTNSEKIGRGFVTLGGFAHYSYVAYGAFTPDGVGISYAPKKKRNLFIIFRNKFKHNVIKYHIVKFRCFARCAHYKKAGAMVGINGLT